MWYVQVDRLSRNNFIDLVEKLQIRGFEDRVEYSEGGWQDYMMHTVQPHLKFDNEDDALSYVLAFGGEISKELPIRLT
jgi:hypothetical protein